MIYAVNYGEDLAAAVAAMVSSGDALMLTGGHVYGVASELRLGNGSGARHIVHGNGAILRASDNMRSVLNVDHNTAVVRDLNIECARLADSGVRMHKASTCIFENVDVYQPLVDGFFSEADNDRCRFAMCNARLCGRIWHTAGYAGPSSANIRTTVTGTCTVGGGVDQYHRVVTFTNLSVPLTSMGLRRGDWISVDPTTPGQTAAMFWAPIFSVDSDSQLTLDFHPFFVGYASPCQFSIHRGDGFHFGPGRADNNIHRLDTCLAENVASSGFYLGGLYGQRCTNLQVNAAGAHPVVVGGAAQERHTLGTFIHGFYTELGLNGASDHVLCEGAIGIDLSTCNAGGNVGVTNPSTNVGVSRNDQYLTDITRYEVPIGTPRSFVDTSPAFTERSGSATIAANERAVVVPWIGLTAAGNVVLTPRSQPPVGLTVEPRLGEFVIRAGGRVARPAVVDFFVSSLT